MKKLIPVILVLASACGSNDGTAPSAPASDISTMTVGEVRVLNPSDIPNGTDLPSGSTSRDYVTVVGNTNPTIDAVAHFLVRADRSAAGSSDLSASVDLNSELNQASRTINAPTPPQQAFDTKVRAFEHQNLMLRSSSVPFGATRLPLRRSVEAPAAPAIGDVLNLKVPTAAAIISVTITSRPKPWSLLPQLRKATSALDFQVIALPGDHRVQDGHEENADEKTGEQAAHDHEREWAL